MKLLLKEKKLKNLEAQIAEATPFNASYKTGLTNEQVNQRIEEGLINKTKKVVTKSYFEIIFKNVFSILNILLISVAIVMMVFGLYKRLFFLLILALNIGISLFQDIKARKLVDKLSLISNPKARVIRNKKEKDIPFNELVLGDIIKLKAGDTIPSDAILLNGNLSVNESFISGESDDVDKKEKDLLYAESYITSGSAYARVINIGSANYASKLQEKAKSFSRPKSEILTSLTTIIKAISIGAIIIGTLEVIIFVLTQSNLVPSVDKTTSSIVAMIPIGMYLMTSITLTLGVIILARHRILVRELYSIEMLARVNMICLDKTGTLTDGNMSVDDLISVGKNAKSKLEEIIGNILFATKDENLTANALKKKYALKPIKGKFSAVPFSSKNKYSAVSFNKHTYILGAYGFIKLSNNKNIKTLVNKYENLGKRVLVLAESNKSIINKKLPNSFIAIGIIVFKENIKVDAKSNIEWFKSNDVAVRIISGDSALSLKAIAKEVGVEGADKVIDLTNLKDSEVKKAAHKYTVFARVTPEQKRILIEELREMGNKVAMIGDGVNDLLALKSADCSIAMASGADAAKAVSHLVSLDSNFSALPKVVEEGRRVINNLQRVCSIFLVKTIFAFSVTIITLIVCWSNNMDTSIIYPYVTNNLFVWEFLTIGVAPFFIAMEPNKERIKGGFINNIIKAAIPAALMQILISIPLILVGYFNKATFPMEGMIAMSVICLSMMSLLILIRVCMPINNYRLYVLIGTAVVMGIIFVIDIFTKSTFIDIEYQAINKACLLLGLLVFIVLIPIYFIFAEYFKRLMNRKNNK